MRALLHRNLERRALKIVERVTRDRSADLHRGGHRAALIGNRAGSLGRQAHPVDRDLVGIRVAGAILGAHAHADAMADALVGVIHHRFFEREAFCAFVLEVEIGVVGLSFERTAEDSLERAVVHAESVQEKFIGSNKFVGHIIFAACASTLSKRALAKKVTCEIALEGGRQLKHNQKIIACAAGGRGDPCTQ